MKKKLHPITNEVEKLVQATIKDFPEMPFYTGDQPRFRIVTITKTWEELTPKEQQDMGGVKQYHPRRKGETFDRPKLIIFKKREAVFVNHAVELRKLYQQKGEPAFDEYIAWVDKMIDKHGMKRPSETEASNVEEKG